MALKSCVLVEAHKGDLFKMQKFMMSMGEQLCHCNDLVCVFLSSSRLVSD